jgi:cell volume regulation protein A
MSEGALILVAGVLMATGLAASLAAGRLRVPGLLLFLGIGMAIGSDGTGWIKFDDYELARAIGIVALALILFEGGLSAGFEEIRSVLAASLSLAFLGTILTAVLTGLAAALLLDFSTLEGLLIGSVLAATDGAAIFALLRGSTLRRKLARTLEGESGFNDPVAILLVIGFTDWIRKPHYGLLDMAGQFVVELSIGLVVGMAIGWLGVQAFRRVQLATGGLYPVASLTTAALAYGLADVLHGSGFLAVYLAGLSLGGATIPAKRTVTAFHQGLAWVAQIALFLTLGLLVFPSQLGDVALEGSLVAGVLVFLARPLGAAVATAPWGYDPREQAVVGWAGLRGAVPVVLATFPVIDQVPDSLEFFNIVFFAVLVSTLVQGSTFEPFARFLGVTTAEPALPRPLAELGTIRRLGAEVVEYPIAADDAIAGCRVRDLGLPRDALVTVVVRGERAIPPRGSMRLEAGDRLHLLVQEEAAHELRDLLDRWHTGPIGPQPRPPHFLAGRAAIFTVRPWSEDDGDPAYPRRVLGHGVLDHLRTRRDAPGALLLLEDGRFAVTGPSVAAGGTRQLQDYARKRVQRSRSDSERAWWQEVIGALAR